MTMSIYRGATRAIEFMNVTHKPMRIFAPNRRMGKELISQRTRKRAASFRVRKNSPAAQRRECRFVVDMAFLKA
jgi:hypothetical protein